ncbi:MAG: hypothetical protein ACOCT9_01830, partial [archaeon]
LCILDYIPNDGNIGSIFWFEINNFLEVLIKSYGKSKSNKNANFFKNKLNQCCARSRFIAKEIGYKIKGLHKALIEENMEKFRPKKIKKSKFLDDYTSVLENLIDQIVNHFKDKSKLYYEFLEKKHIIHLLKECRKKMLQICKRVDEKLIRIQRIHQDLHMEQILYKRKETMGSNSSELSYNYYFLDFEGDPQFSYKKKNSLFPVERDLASLSRSLSYIKFNAFKNNLHLINSQLDAEHKKLRKLYYLIFHSEALEEQKELQEIKFLLDGWEKKMQKNIITNYQIELDLFNFFTIERILRELAYEIKYRPKNIMIPIFGLKKTIA